MGFALLAHIQLYASQSLAFKKSIFPLFVGQLFFVLSAPVAIWTIGGLEQPLIAGGLAWTIVLMFQILSSDSLQSRTVLLLSLCLGVLAISRSDGFIFTFITLAAIVIIRGINSRTMLLCLQTLVFPLVFCGGQTIFRLWYYRELIPNTALVKVSPSLFHFSEGWNYLTTGFFSLGPFSFISICSLVFMLWSQTVERYKAIFLIIIATVWSFYLGFIGGDIFPAFRHFIPLIVIMPFAITNGILYIWQRLRTILSKAILIFVIILSAFSLKFPSISHLA